MPTRYTSSTSSWSSTMSSAAGAENTISRRGNDSAAIADLSKFYCNPFLSDVSLKVGGRSYHAHKLVLVKSSIVFERMFSPDWQRASNQDDMNIQILELLEEPSCSDVFDIFLRYLYFNEVGMHPELALPLLMLADKYNIASLQEVCVQYVIDEVLPEISKKDIFHVWFQYSLKGGHDKLMQRCIKSLAECMCDIIHSDDWNEEFIGLDIEQMVTILKSNDLEVKEEIDIWNAIIHWLHASTDRISQSHILLTEIVKFIHFPMMTPSQLSEIEANPFVRQHQEIVEPYIRLAYKYHALPLSVRLANQDFCLDAGCQLLVRSYFEVRWERRFIISQFSSVLPGTEVTYRFNTRACAVPLSSWDWELKLFPRGTVQYPTEARCQLMAVSEMNSRSIEYLISLVSNTRVVETVAGRRTLNRSQPVIDLDFSRIGSIVEENVENDCLAFQLMIRPAM